MAEAVSVRHYEPRDRGAVRRIAVDTALAGRPASEFIDADELVADALTQYFTDYEPESCFVAEIGGQVVGYLIGSIDTYSKDKLEGQKIYGGLFAKALGTGFFLKRKNWVLLWRCLISFLGGEFYAPDFTREYPATLHINLLSEARRSGGGRALMTAYLTYLSDKKAKGVRMASISPTAADFFRKNGFSLLFQGRRSYLRHVVGTDVPLYIFGRKVS